MRKPSIFITSSGRSRPLLEQLHSALQRSTVFSDIRTWMDLQETVGTTMTQRLQDLAKRCDFFAAVLTEEDITPRDTSGSKAIPNHIFEAGLFVGALGIDFRRCFIISSLSEQALPTDLAGATVFSIRPVAMFDDEECLREIQRIVPMLLMQVQAQGSFRRPVVPMLTGEELVSLENIDNLRPGDSVLVKSSNPLELRYQFAVNAMKNMNLDVDYVFFLSGDRSGLGTDLVWAMIQNLAVVGLTDGFGRPSHDELFKSMDKNLSLVSSNLDVMRRQLTIHFVTQDFPFQFRIQNAYSEISAKCYVEYSNDGFVEWYKDVPSYAKAVAAELLRRGTEAEQNSIFRSTRDFELAALLNRQFVEGLLRRLQKYFPPKLRAKVAEIFFGAEWLRSDPFAAHLLHNQTVSN